MRLSELRIHRSWTDDKLLQGKIRVESPAGEITLNLDDEQCNRLIMVVANELVDTARDVAKNLTQQTLEAKEIVCLA
jgi:flagellar biosynthesis/type III secretory pathway protein FliH